MDYYKYEAALKYHLIGEAGIESRMPPVQRQIHLFLVLFPFQWHGGLARRNVWLTGTLPAKMSFHDHVLGASRPNPAQKYSEKG